MSDGGEDVVRVVVFVLVGGGGGVSRIVLGCFGRAGRPIGKVLPTEGGMHGFGKRGEAQHSEREDPRA